VRAVLAVSVTCVLLDHGTVRRACCKPRSLCWSWPLTLLTEVTVLYLCCDNDEYWTRGIIIVTQAYNVYSTWTDLNVIYIYIYIYVYNYYIESGIAACEVERTACCEANEVIYINVVTLTLVAIYNRHLMVLKCKPVLLQYTNSTDLMLHASFDIYLLNTDLNGTAKNIKMAINITLRDTKTNNKCVWLL